MEAFGRLLDVMDDLREKCPWDRKQTYQSLRPNTIEETYELCEAIVNEDEHNICKELGDVLLHIVFYAKIGQENGAYDIADVCNQLCDKLIYRHPHVYGEAVANTAAEVVQTWEQRKQTERDGNRTVLSGVPAALPSLIKAYRIQDKARGVGFDWSDRNDVWAKVKEEISEFEAELRRMEAVQQEEDAAMAKAKAAATDELGDVLFSIINAARLFKLNPDNALEHTNRKFISRFNYVEEQAKQQGRNIKELTLEEMDRLWEEAKTLAKP